MFATVRCERSAAANRSDLRSKPCCAASSTSSCSTSPTTSSTFPPSAGSRQQLADTRKTVLYISHDRELLAATATKIVTIEAWGAWTHGGSFAGYADAKAREHDKRDRDRALYDDERQRLEDYVKLMRERARISEAFAPKLKAAESKLRQFLDNTNDRRRSATSASTCASAAPAPASVP
jgi:ATPase subunit of ABC transporter with duplicated ATPase domains